MGDAAAVEKYFNYKRDGPLGAFGIEPADWEAFLAKNPGKRFEIEALFVNIAPSNAKKLAKDLEDAGLASYLYGNGKYVRAWEKLVKYPNVRKDIDFLTSYTRVLDDANLVNPPINIENRIKDWIETSHLKCKTCANGSEPFLDEVLDNVYGFRNHLSKPGAVDILDNLGLSTKAAEGANWLMKFVKEREN
ncbi:MAG: hypothetical protein M9911_12575 [Saprospiraceae bacterium]|nr:hypothetical protein [Saprospiraceae bacterium]